MSPPPRTRAPRGAPAGGYALGRARRLEREALAERMASILALAVALGGSASLGPARGGWASGAAATAGLLGSLGALRRRQARHWRSGGEGERRVGRQLARLRRRGWLVIHDVPKPSGGNVDHIAAGPTNGVFTIETKLRRFGRRELAQARDHAGWARRQLGVAVVPVLCVAEGRGRPRRYAGVWCMGSTRLVGFLLRFRGAPVDIDDVARAIGRLPSPAGPGRAGGARRSGAAPGRPRAAGG